MVSGQDDQPIYRQNGKHSLALCLALRPALACTLL